MFSRSQIHEQDTLEKKRNGEFERYQIRHLLVFAAVSFRMAVRKSWSFQVVISQALIFVAAPIFTA